MGNYSSQAANGIGREGESKSGEGNDQGTGEDGSSWGNPEPEVYDIFDPNFVGSLWRRLSLRTGPQNTSTS